MQDIVERFKLQLYCRLQQLPIIAQLQCDDCLCACICQKNVYVKEKMCMYAAEDAGSSAKIENALAELWGKTTQGGESLKEKRNREPTPRRQWLVARKMDNEMCVLTN